MSEVFDGTVEVQDGSATTTVLLDGTQGDARLGGGGQPGTLHVLDASGNLRVDVDGASGGITITTAAGAPVVEVRPNGAVGIFRSIGGDNREVVRLNGPTAELRLGAQGRAGNVRVHDAADRQVVHIAGSNAAIYVGAEGNEGDIVVRDGAGRDAVHVNGANAQIFVGAQGNEGDLIVRDGEARQVIHANGSNAGLYVGASGNEGDVIVRDGGGRETIHLDGGGSNVTVRRRVGRTLRDVLHFNGGNAALYIGSTGNEGDVIVRDSGGRDAVHINGANAQVFVGTQGNEGDLIVRDAAGRDVFHMDGQHAALYIGGTGNEGDLIIRDAGGRDVFHFSADFAVLDVGASGNEGDIRVRDNAGNVRIHLDGNSGDIQLHGADCAEHFDIRDADVVDAGTVVVIDETGGLRQSTTAYDARVAGIVSGAGGYKPGILLDSFASAPDRRPVALAGKVFCKVDASSGAIAVGDLLTTSDTPGHAMRVDDPARAFGAVLGKALAPLSGGCGLVPVLVTLQ